MTDEDVIEKFHHLVRFGSRREYLRKQRTKILYRWVGAGHKAAGLMMSIWPLLSQRRQDKVVEVLNQWKAKKLRRVKPPWYVNSC